MKKILSILICASLLLISGCTRSPAVVATDPTKTTAQTATSELNPTEQVIIPVPLEMPLLSLTAPVVIQTHRAADGTVLFTYDCQSFDLTLEDPHIAESIVIDLLNLTDFENAAVQSILSEAKAAYTKQTDWVPYGFSTLYTPKRFDTNILSLYGTQRIQSGALHSSSAAISVTYDLISGRRLTLNDILKQSYSADTLSQLISESLQTLAQQGMLYSDYAYVITELFTTNKPSDSWFFSQKGLCFYFAPYEIAPYSAGTVIAEVPYSALTGLLRDEYFPAEQVASVGTLRQLPFAGTDLTGFTEFSELILDAQGTKHLIYPDGILQNVRVTSGTWLEDGTFRDETTLFAAASLCSGDALVLQLPQELPYGLLLTYVSEDNTVSVDLLSLIHNP